MPVLIKRIYDAPSPNDGYRVLVDRLWPRGVKKETAGINLWLKEVAPSTELRKWFNHEPERWKVFSSKYSNELRKSSAFDELKILSGKYKTITLLYSAKDEIHNQAIVLQKMLKS